MADDGADAAPRVRARLADKPIPRKWRRAGTADQWRREELEKKNKSKYHHLKFVEKKKIARQMKTTRRLLEAAQSHGREDEAAQLRKLLKVQLRDFEYVQYYPKHLPYNALFPAEDSEASKRRREEIRKMIKARIAKNGEERVIDVLDENDIDYSAINAAKDAISSTIGATPVKKSSREKWLAKRERKMRAKARKSEQGSEAVEELAEVANVSEDVRQRKGKRKNRDAPEQELAAEEALEDRGASKRKDMKDTKKKKVRTENAETAQASHKPKRHKKDTKETVRNDVHPSWNAAKTKEKSGALVKGTGARTTFDNDSDD